MMKLMFLSTLCIVEIYSVDVVEKQSGTQKLNYPFFIFLFSISTTFITPPNYYMWLHVIAFLVISGPSKHQVIK